MTHKVLLLLGTKKGAFILESDQQRNSWELRGPFCDAWPINHVIADPKTQTIYAGGGNEWFGPAVWRSEDLGQTWTHSSEGLGYAESDDAIKAVWSLALKANNLYAGVEPAGLFRSLDRGQSFAHIEALRNHPSKEHWQPGGGGLILHSIVLHPEDDKKLWIAISAAGVFYSEDGGQNWSPRNQGTRADFLPEGQNYPEFGQCVHNLVMAPGNPDLLYQQNHCGMYRSEDGGQNWISIEEGLPSSFGFPAAVHPTDPAVLYLIPLNGDIAGRYMPDGKAAVWKTMDYGKNWKAHRAGLPQENVFFGVLRQAMATDQLDPAGVYFGSSSGCLYGSVDEGEEWQQLAEHLPPIYSVETLCVES